MGATIEQTGEDSVRVRLQGALNVAVAAKVREGLMEALEGASEIRVDISEMEAIDFYGLQLLCAAHRSSVLKKKSLNFTGEVPEAIRSTMETAGFIRHQGCCHCPAHVKCLWVN